MGALSTALQTILGHVEDAYTEAELTAPTRAYVSVGPPPADCELVAVWGVPALRERGGNADPGNQNCSIIPRASITVGSWLCVPTGTPPAVDALTEAALRLHDHVWAVWSHLARLITRGEIYDGLRCARSELQNAAVIFPEEGAYVGWQIPLLVDLDPFRTDPAS